MTAVDLSSSFGALFIGLLISVAFFGLTIGQTWFYFWKYWDKDRKPLKLFIVFITVVDAARMAIITYGLYWYLVLNFGNAKALESNPWLLNIPGPIGGVCSSAIELYYARQIYLVSQRMIAPIIIVALVICSTTISFYLTAKLLFAEELVSRRLKFFIRVGGVAMILCIVVDVLITGAMCWALYHKKTGFRKTDSMIKTLMAYIINTNLLTSILCIAMTVTYVTSPGSLVPVAIMLTLTTCYVNSVLAMLNSRDFIRHGSTFNSDGSYRLSSIRVTPPPGEAFGSKPAQTEISVLVSRSIALDHSQDHEECAFEVPKLGAPIASRSRSRASESSV